MTRKSRTSALCASTRQPPIALRCRHRRVPQFPVGEAISNDERTDGRPGVTIKVEIAASTAVSSSTA
jgi:hypothetical protein